MNLEKAIGSRDRAHQRLKLFKYYYDSYNARGALNPEAKKDVVAMCKEGLGLVRKARYRMNKGEYLVAKHIYDKASDVLGKAIDQMHERGGI